MTVRALYIAGNGRSGSTLLDRVLGQVPGAVSLGEVRWIWESGFARDNLCECGEPFRRCPFWGEVARETFPEVDPASAKAIALRSRRLLWTPAIARLAGWFQTSSFRDLLREQVELHHRIFRAVAEKTQAAILIDSSKLASFALLLRQLPDVELHVVHLIRDSRAVAFSWKRRRLKPEVTREREHMQVRPAYLTALRWDLHNLLNQSLARVAKSYQRVRYEDFVRAPERTVRRILDEIGLAHDGELGFMSNGEVEITAGHTVAGNPSRFARGRIPIRVDDEWRSLMTFTDKALVTLLTLPQLLAYGYAIRSSRSPAPPAEHDPEAS